MVVRLLTLLLLLNGLLAQGQIGGSAAYQFLNLGSAPRQVALGGKVVTNFDYDPTQAFFNPATINPAMDNQLALTINNYIGDVSYGTASYAYLWDRRTQVFHTGVTYINYGSFDGYDAQGNPTNTFSGGEMAVSFGHAKNIPFSNFYVGANIKFISSTLEQYNSTGMAIDAGILYRDEDAGLNLGLVARNFGAQLDPYDITAERLPFEIIFGASQDLENIPIRWHFTLEHMENWRLAFANPNRDEIDLEGNATKENITLVDELFRHMILGVELFPDKGFNLRLGYNFRRGEELRIVDQRSFAGLSAGFGIKLNKLRFSYAYSKYNSAAASSFFGLNMNLQ
ncbi:MAG: type IX secretion system protein PorQ [Flavobacteriaceae bacterium]|jgi:hypothetical protein|nr:type IX secretion system protein PorQ [Flavobacteriaceae bacterium]MDG1063906.1 type IX secretion system protein PorQ [Flavobacteriaceae bacterium]MDG1961988.1 type IX secretion system protein PorQ [Flavobacteriaceae bacterium]